jgi:TonB-linked SusC/RagA family outer membrane protein
LKLQDIVVTGVVGETPRVKLPFGVERLDDDDMPVITSNAAALLTGKGAGISVVQGSGQPGQAPNILLRGPTSIDASGRSQAPLIVIDGVIQSEDASLADVNALDIDHVEIVKGAAAASLYGARAQNGVIQISTKRGQTLATNTFNVTLRGEYGYNELERGIDLHQKHPYLLTADGSQFIGDDGGFYDVEALGRITNPVFNPPPWDPTGVGTPSTSFQDQSYPGQTYDQLNRFFDPGDTYSVYAAATGRFGESSFRASFENFKESGVISCSDCFAEIKDDGYTRYNARLNIDSRLGSQFDIAASGFYSNSEQDDAAVASGAFFSLTFMSPAFDLTDTGCDKMIRDEAGRILPAPDANCDPNYPFDGFPRIDIDPTSQEENPLYQVGARSNTDRRTRTMGSIDLSWTPITWFSVEANASYDRTDFQSFDVLPKDHKSFSRGTIIDFDGGRLNANDYFNQSIGASLTAGFNYGFMDGDLATRLKVRYVYEDQEYSQFSASGQEFTVPEVPSFGNISGSKDAGNWIQDIRGEGYFLIASADYKGRYIADGLVRRDGSSLFGPDERWATYYRLSGAWRVAQEDFWGIDWWDEFKLRYSYGTAGGRPRFVAQYETFSVSQGNVSPTNLGNRALKPEFTIENEAGINLVFMQNLGLDVTYAWGTTDDQLLQVPLPGFVGFSSQWQNAGTIKSNTWEASLRYAAIDKPDVGLTFRLTWDKSTNEITELNVPAYTTGASNVVWFIAEGEPLGAVWGSSFAKTCSDAASRAGVMGQEASDWCSANGSQFQVNDDGWMVYVGDNNWQDGFAEGLWGTTGDVDGTTYEFGMPIKAARQRRTCLRQNPDDAGIGDACPLSEFLPLGDGLPDWNGAFFTNFRYKGLSVNFLVDASVGLDVYNLTEQWAWRQLRGSVIDQTGKPDANKKPTAYYGNYLYDTAGTSEQFMQDGTWFKFREVSLGYSLPQNFLQNVFKGTVDRLTINLIGRNLFTITDYTGYDPEVGSGGGGFASQVVGRADLHGYPNFRAITASLEVVF